MKSLKFSFHYGLTQINKSQQDVTFLCYFILFFLIGLHFFQLVFIWNWAWIIFEFTIDDDDDDDDDDDNDDDDA